MCYCHDARPNCLTEEDPKVHKVFPGQTISLSVLLVGQDFGAVSGAIYAHFLREDTLDMMSGQDTVGVENKHCSTLSYTIFSRKPKAEGFLVLTSGKIRASTRIDSTHVENDKALWNCIVSNNTRNNVSQCSKYAEASGLQKLESPHILFPESIYKWPLYIKIHILHCPLGFKLTTEQPFRCDCNQLLQHISGILCHIQDQTIARSGQVWVGSIPHNNTLLASEYCPPEYCTPEPYNVSISDPDSQCSHNHSGILCGGCQPGLSLALGSSRCLLCSNTHLLLLIPFALTGVFLVLLLKVLNLTISQGTFNGFIVYANIIKTNDYIFFSTEDVNPLTLFLSWLNLDFGIETCFFSGLTAYSKTWLQFSFPFYIWSIAGLIIILAKYSDRLANVMGNNSVPVLATILLLSHAKLFRTVITVLSYTIVFTEGGSRAVWSGDGTHTLTQ